MKTDFSTGSPCQSSAHTMLLFDHTSGAHAHALLYRSQHILRHFESRVTSLHPKRFSSDTSVGLLCGNGHGE